MYAYKHIFCLYIHMTKIFHQCGIYCLIESKMSEPPDQILTILHEGQSLKSLVYDINGAHKHSFLLPFDQPRQTFE